MSEDLVTRLRRFAQTLRNDGLLSVWSESMDEAADLLAPKPASPEEWEEVTDADVMALHEALGGNGWAYTNYGGDELNSQRDRLEAGVRAVRAAHLARAARDKGSEG